MTQTTDIAFDINDQLIAIVGYSATGKSASLRNIPNKSRWLYMNTEAGKRLPFKNDFKAAKVTDPYQITGTFDWAMQPENYDSIDGIIIDSLTFLMDMYESMYVIGSANTMAGWSNYQQYFKQLLQEKVPKFNKPVIFIAHVRDDYDEKNMEIKTAIPIKGALKNNGIEAYFSTIVAAKRVAIKDLEKYQSDLLNITEDEQIDGFKHVFQTKLTKTTTGERIRSPMGMFTREQTFMDNDAAMLLRHMNSYYHD